MKFKHLSIAILLASSFIASAEISVVVHPSNSEAISQDNVKSIFLGKMKSFPTGKSIKAINLSSKSGLRAEFNKKALNKSSSQVKAYWSKLVFSGKGRPLKEMNSDAEVKAFIAENPDAIGYIDSNAVDTSVKSVLML